MYPLCFLKCQYIKLRENEKYCKQNLEPEEIVNFDFLYLFIFWHFCSRFLSEELPCFVFIKFTSCSWAYFIRDIPERNFFSGIPESLRFHFGQISEWKSCYRPGTTFRSSLQFLSVKDSKPDNWFSIRFI